MLGAVLGQKDHLRLAGKGFDVGRIRQPTGAHVTFDDFGKVLFVKRDVALGHRDHLGAIGMATADGGAEVRQTGGYDCT
jgi:hypothetical protein